MQWKIPWFFNLTLSLEKKQWSLAFFMIHFAFVFNWKPNSWASMSHQRLNSDNQIENLFFCFVGGLWCSAQLLIEVYRDIVLSLVFLCMSPYFMFFIFNITFIECWKNFSTLFFPPARVLCTIIARIIAVKLNLLLLLSCSLSF